MFAADWSKAAVSTLPVPEPTQVRFMILNAEQAWRDLLDAIDGVTERQAWALPPMNGSGDLATRGSILEIVQHLAASKFMYASTAFRQHEIGWDTCFGRIRELESDWPANVAYLQESHRYWMRCWEDLEDRDLTQPRMTNWGAYWPAWRIVSTISNHDAYHAGQIVLLRAILPPADKPCLTHADYSLAALDAAL